MSLIDLVCVSALLASVSWRGSACTTSRSTDVCELPLQCCDLPKGREVRCTISPQPEGFVGSLYVGCEFSPFFIHSESPCDVWVGMSVVVECVNDTELFREGRALGGSSLQLPSAGVDDGGVYECRDGRGSVVGQRNVTVHGEMVVATAAGPNTCLGQYYCNTTARCCRPTDSSSVLQGNLPLTYPFNVYGEGPFGLTVEMVWINHYPVDLGLRVDVNDSTTVQHLVVSSWPETITPSDSPTVLLRVTANNSYSSSTACFPFSFTEPTPYLSANSSLPRNQTVAVGGTAVFECEMGTSVGLGQLGFHVRIEYDPPFNTTDEIICKSGNCNCDPCRIEVVTTDKSNSLSKVYRYEVRIHDVEVRDNRTVLSCALESNGVVQWKREATLTVTTARATGGRDDEDGAPEYTAFVVAVVLLVLVVVILVVAGTVYLCRAKRLRTTPSEDRIPLYLRDDSMSPPLMESTLLTSHQLHPLPAITVSGSDSRHRDGSPRPSDTHSMDSGITHGGSLNSSLEDMAFGAPFSPAQLSAHFAVPAGAGYKSRSKSLSDLLPIPGSGDRPCRRRRLCVYVSYSDCKSEWVMRYLKPLIESFQNTSVTIHDADMIAGQPISEERLRLIVEADKVVIVCSPDYSNSGWCKYELYHAIRKQPSLTEGRIIPILCGGCPSAPSVIGAVVAIRDNDEDFYHKLRAALFRMHRASH